MYKQTLYIQYTTRYIFLWYDRDFKVAWWANLFRPRCLRKMFKPRQGKWENSSKSKEEEGVGSTESSEFSGWSAERKPAARPSSLTPPHPTGFVCVLQLGHGATVTHFTIGWNTGSAWSKNMEIPIFATSRLPFKLVHLYSTFFCYEILQSAGLFGWSKVTTGLNPSVRVTWACANPLTYSSLPSPKATLVGGK